MPDHRITPYTLLLFCLLHPLAGYANTIFETATTGQLCEITHSTSQIISSDRFLAVNFEITETTTIGSIGGHIIDRSGTHSPVFGAIVALSGPEDTPDSTDLSTSDVVGATLLVPRDRSDNLLGELVIELSPGWYALVLGSGLFGATGFAGAVTTNTSDGVSQIYSVDPSDGSTSVEPPGMRLFVNSPTTPIFRVIADASTPLPGTSGPRYSFGRPRIRDGVIVFVAGQTELSPSFEPSAYDRLYRTRNDEPILVACTNMCVPARPGLPYLAVIRDVIAIDSDTVAFVASTENFGFGGQIFTADSTRQAKGLPPMMFPMIPGGFPVTWCHITLSMSGNDIVTQLIDLVSSGGYAVASIRHGVVDVLGTSSYFESFDLDLVWQQAFFRATVDHGTIYVGVTHYVDSELHHETYRSTNGAFQPIFDVDSQVPLIEESGFRIEVVPRHLNMAIEAETNERVVIIKRFDNEDELVLDTDTLPLEVNSNRRLSLTAFDGQYTVAVIREYLNARFRLTEILTDVPGSLETLVKLDDKLFCDDVIGLEAAYDSIDDGEIVIRAEYMTRDNQKRAQRIVAAHYPGISRTNIKADLIVDKPWTYSSLPGQTNQSMTVSVASMDDPLNNSSYTYTWKMVAPHDVDAMPITLAGGDSTSNSWQFAIPACSTNGVSDTGETHRVIVTVTGGDHGNSGTFSVDFAPSLLGDVNNDGTVNVADRSIANAIWRTGKAGEFTVRDADVNGDGTVNVADRSIINAVWRGALCSNSVSTPCVLR